VEHQGTHENAMENFTDQDLSSILDQMLSKADKDNDGYLNYSEFVGSTGIKVDTH
jgi:Ca2+-binding EF-hand superfamily protein